MLKGLNFFFYQLRAQTLKSGKMIDSNSVHFPLYPLSANSQRMMKFSGNANSIGITPLEISDFLYQLSFENLSELKEQADQVQPRLKEIDQGLLPIRMYHLLFNAEYRYGNLSRRTLEEKEKFIGLSSDYLKKLLKISKVSSLPIGVASNYLFAKARLGLGNDKSTEEILTQLVSAKVQFMHAKGIIETIWALLVLKSQDSKLISKLVAELQSRKVEKYENVLNAPFNHLEYISDPTPTPNLLSGLLSKSSELAVDENLKKVLADLAAQYN